MKSLIRPIGMSHIREMGFSNDVADLPGKLRGISSFPGLPFGMKIPALLDGLIRQLTPSGNQTWQWGNTKHIISYIKVIRGDFPIELPIYKGFLITKGYSWGVLLTPGEVLAQSSKVTRIAPGRCVNANFLTDRVELQVVWMTQVCSQHHRYEEGYIG